MRLPTTLDVYAARGRLRARLAPTPLRSSPWLSDRTGASVFLKHEALNLTGSFKIRGAFNALLALVESAPGGRPLVVTASAGNHGRAIALAADELGLRAVVFTPNDAPETKKAGIRRHGARLVDDCADYDIAEQHARQFADAEGGVYVSPYSHPDVIAGAGTIGLEIVESLPRCQVVVAPIGGGGLASGIGLAMKAVSPQVEVIGVEVEASAPFARSLEAGRIVEIAIQPTLADGLAGNLEPDAITLPLVKRFVDRIVLVSEDDLEQAMRLVARAEQLIVEGAGAAALAALVGNKVDVRGKQVAVLVTGGNIDLARWMRVVGETS
ncbi:MAG: threonine ammonia-lyase [Vicinamibacterales bacterium]